MMGHGSNDVGANTEWEVVHAALMTIAQRRGALDAEEARLLRRAEDVQIWLRFGMVSPLDYLERKLGYAPHTANERLRVAAALAELPDMERALETGELCFSAVRELTRVATQDGEAAWIAYAAGKTAREIEQKVAMHDHGDLPTDLARPVEAQPHRVSIDLPPETYARWRQAIVVLSDEHGRRLDLPSFVGALLDAALSDKVPDGDLGRARYQIAVTMCARCRQATQEGGGVQVPIGPEALACASCDAVEIGSIDGDGPEATPATQTIPPKIRRFVMHRDGRKCGVPGCRSAKHLDVHHIHHREHGGDHDPSLLVTMCGSCHAAHHRGDLIVRGTAKELVVERPHDPEVRGDRRSHVGSTVGNVRDDARLALVTLGFTPTIARAALARVPPERMWSLEGTIREALRNCAEMSRPRPLG